MLWKGCAILLCYSLDLSIFLFEEDGALQLIVSSLCKCKFLFIDSSSCYREVVVFLHEWLFQAFSIYHFISDYFNNTFTMLPNIYSYKIKYPTVCVLILNHDLSSLMRS